MWKIQLTITVNFTSSEDNDEDNNVHVMHSKSDNIDIMINDEADEFIELFKSLLKRYQNNLEIQMKGNEFVLIMLIYCIINVIKYI